jgi:hypothetical protein
VIVSDTAGERHIAEEVTDVQGWVYMNRVDDRLATGELGKVY